MVNAVKFMLANDDEIPGLKSVHLVLHHIFCVSLQKQKDLIIAVVVELEMGIGGGG